MIFKNKNIFEVSNTYRLLKKKLKKNQNIQSFLKKKKINDADSIKISYDIQSGSYIKFFNSLSRGKINKVYGPIIKTINKEFPKIKNILDFGCGELTTSLFIFNGIKKKIKNYYANDFSLNRLILGQNYIKRKLSNNDYKKFKLFCNSNFELPFKNNSIDLVLTIHSLEPNNKNKKNIIKELMRVSRYGLILMEPHYEISSEKQKKRMVKLNYIRNIKKLFNKKHNEIKIIKKEHHINNLNISSLFVVKKNKIKSSDPGFVEPSTNFELNRINNFLYSKKSFRLYPTFNEICIFSNESNFFISKIE